MKNHWFFFAMLLYVIVVLFAHSTGLDDGIKTTENRMLGKCIVAGETTSFCAALVRP